MNTISVSASQARTKFFDLLEEVDNFRRVVITRYGKIKAVILNPEEVEGWEETQEILSIPGALKSIRKGEAEVNAGKYYTLDEVLSGKATKSKKK